MFNSNRYITKGVQSEIPIALQIFMWDCITNLKEPKDYLQVFRLSSVCGMQSIVHSQEQPEYTRPYLINFENPVNAKVFVIDDDDHCTMLLAQEY